MINELLGAVVAVLVAAASVAYYFGKKYSTTPPDKRRQQTSSNTAVLDRSRPGPTLSIVVPCYNEEERLPPMLKETIAFCEETKMKATSNELAQEEGLFGNYEIIVVDDCSKDGTVGVVKKAQAENPGVNLRLVQVTPNHGKGFAVRSGFFAASGDYVLMADGDNATRIEDTKKLFLALRGPKVQLKLAKGGRAPSIALGSRAHLEKDAIAQRTFFRTLLMKAFHLVVAVTYFVCTSGKVCAFRDTQCGFKLFDRRACEKVFANARLERWAFDVEILLLAKHFGLSGKEVPVRWAEIPGSKVNFKGMAQMGVECVLMCFTYPLGFWPIA